MIKPGDGNGSPMGEHGSTWSTDRILFHCRGIREHVRTISTLADEYELDDDCVESISSELLGLLAHLDFGILGEVGAPRPALDYR